MKPIFYLSILLSSLLLTSCYRKFDLEEYRTTPKMVINSAFSPDTVVMASISRTWFHSESKPDVTIRNAKVELYIDGIFKEEMPWKEYSYWKYRMILSLATDWIMMVSDAIIPIFIL